MHPSVHVSLVPCVARLPRLPTQRQTLRQCTVLFVSCEQLLAYHAKLLASFIVTSGLEVPAWHSCVRASLTTLHTFQSKIDNLKDVAGAGQAGLTNGKLCADTIITAHAKTDANLTPCACP